MDADDDVPAYIPMPLAGIPILPPTDTSMGPPDVPRPAPGSTQAAAAAAFPSYAPGSAPFPPPPTAPAARKLMPTTASLSTNVSDLVLSSLLPANLPKLPTANHAPGRARELTSQREGLGLNVMSNNFRRFVTKVGPIFWLQDRVEEVLFWQKPAWTWSWMVLWSFICFQPRVLLFLPTAVLLVIYTWYQERKNPLPSLFGVTLTPTPVGSARVGAETDPNAYSTSTVPESEGQPVVPPKEAESSVDYYMNIQAIQNLMGLIADAFDTVVPYLQLAGGKDTSPTSFPLTPSTVILALIPPTLLLPLTPAWAIKYLLLPAGLAPPLMFHPNTIAAIEALPRSRRALQARAFAEEAVMTDALTDDLGRRPLGRVEVWENERLDPAVASKAATTVAPPGSWSARFLRTGERPAWVKVRRGADSAWAKEEVGDDGPNMVLNLKEHWEFVPGEDWRVDVCGLWSDVGTDTDGWAYSDEHWQHPCRTAVDEPASSSSPTSASTPRRVTRRRRWWRRVYEDCVEL